MLSLSISQKMRSIILLGLVAFAAGALLPHTGQVKEGDTEFLKRQEDLLILFRHPHQPDWNPRLVGWAKSYHIKEHLDYYTNVEAVKEFWKYYEHGMLPKGEVFNIMYDHHREQAVALFHLFYYAKDWDTLYKSACWARYYVNEGMFIYSLTVAVTHRKDTTGMILPAPYEIYPYYFINSEVIQKAHEYKMRGYQGMKQVEGIYTVTIPVNYTGSYLHTNNEQRISYFTEDIGLNSYYYYFHTDYPFWMGGQEYGLKQDRRGELYLYEHQQILARYYMERLSNGLGHIPEFSWYHPIATGYYPDLTYYNGHSFPTRDNYYNMYTPEKYPTIEVAHDMERRIRDVIDLGYMYHPVTGVKIDLTKPESIDILGNLIHSNVDSVNNRYYKYVALFARMIMGASVVPVEHHKVIPSVLEHFETSMRDPLFYQIYKRIVKYYYQFKDHLKPYTYEELYYPGVKIDSVTVDKLVTYFDNYDIDITNVVDMEPEPYVPGKYDNYPEILYKPDPVLIKARTTRLNHKPFTYKLSVMSDKPMKSVVRVFLAPKYNEYGVIMPLHESRENYYELDYFLYDLVSGKNVISRNSLNFNGYVKDRTTYYELYRKVFLSIKGEEKFSLDMSEAHCGFPHRLMLPKGTKGGMVFQLFFIVSPYHEPTVPLYKGYDPTVSCGVGSGARYMDSLPLGYPFDRQIDERVFYKVPNLHFEDVTITHKLDINTIV